MRKKCVLFFINSEVGGAERMSVLISKMLMQAGHEVQYVIINEKENTTSIINFLPKDYKAFFVESKSHFDKLKQFYRLIKSIKPDVVFSSHYCINDKVLLLKPLFRKIKFIIRSDNYYFTFSWLEKTIIQLTYRMADVMIAQTQEMKDEFVSHRVMPLPKVIALDNPVDKENIEKKVATSISPYPKDNNKNIVAVGRFAYQKGYDNLVQAFAILLEKHQNCCLYIVGSNEGKWKSEYDRVKILIEKKNLEKYVYCVGYQDNPYSYIKYADCFVLSSRWEGLPNVLAEALYLRTPVAAFKCIPVIERMVRNHIDGYLAEKDDIKGLAAAMESSLTLGRTNPLYCGASSDDYVKLF